MKKAQISMFIIIGIILVIIVAFAYTFISSLNPSSKQDSGNVHSFVQGCLVKSGGDAVHIVTLRGGYLNPVQTITISSRDITLLNSGNTNLVPDMDFVKLQIESKSEELFTECIDDFSAFQGRFETGISKITVDIYADSISLMLDYPITISHQDTMKTYNKFVATIDSINLPSVFAAAEHTVNDLIARKMYNLTLLKSLGIQTKAIDYKDATIFDFNDNGILHLVYAVK
ncbi:MAG: hypothetical protein U9R34_06135 [Nanoarchaeota archaeon]|nr:hypothetical protein [Nanoarchaeota archaeon]